MENINYFDRAEISNSDLFFYKNEGINNFIAYKERLITKKDNSSLTLGSLVHCLVLEPHLFENLYIVFDGEKPNHKYQDLFCERIIGIYNDFIDAKPLRNLYLRDIYSSIYSVKNDSKEQIEKKSLDLYNKLEKYIFCLNEKKQKPECIIISNEEQELAINLSSLVNENNFIQNLNMLVNNNLNNCLFEFKEKEIYFTYPNTNVKCRSKIDWFIINPITKELILIDIKTTRNNYYVHFKKSIKDYGYDRQMVFYRAAIKEYITQEEFKSYLEKINYLDCYETILNEIDFYEVKTYIVAIQTETPNSVKIYNIQYNSFLMNFETEIVNDLLNLSKDFDEYYEHGGKVDIDKVYCLIMC